MAHITRRLYTTAAPSSPTSAVSIASRFLASSQSLPPHKHTQLLDANQLQLLFATLSRSGPLPQDGTPLPACYHLAYFTPSQHEQDLGRDGTDTTFNPPRPFTRRMWAGGELEWVSGKEKGLRIGQRVTEMTRLVRADGKRTRAGEEMVVVGVEKTFENESGVAVVDKR
jgi:hydroxyacyl-ACP dehydratase HTD2-like protein with hotdog domain